MTRGYKLKIAQSCILKRNFGINCQKLGINKALYAINQSKKDKINWVRENFSVTQKYIEDRI